MPIFDYTLAAYIFCTLIGVVVIFQLALALGAPWGEMAMGGKFPGRFPPLMRIVALFQIVLLVLIAFMVLARAGLAFEGFFDISKSVIWGIVAFCLIGAILNSTTPSKKEKMLWMPIAIALLICSIIVAMS